MNEYMYKNWIHSQHLWRSLFTEEFILKFMKQQQFEMILSNQ